MNSFPSIIRASRRRVNRKLSGFTLIEILLVLAILGFLFMAAYPAFIKSTSSLRLELAARQMQGALRAARSYAIRHSANVAVKFRYKADGAFTYALYRDGDGDGVHTNDILRGTDPEIWAPRPINYLSEDIRVAIPPGRPPRHPGNPRRRLDRTDDPIRFNASDMASFSPIGRVTPGSIYLSDAYRHLKAVRTYHLSGKVSVLTYNEREETWR